ncbi:hypothetical protein FisN_10Lu329 [Fistulifera solaris]|uniref:Uncharacterized protein n=1 Tax=Fistulifera solaris TaxID=1519565 RepID=A0A1Z5KFM2_FISSO|nr:hypothetical protein FisN_10Lu329 [Fistulifera solaris]|eukprot:GAX25114.1 hypothetical protein FisN_10Lu329 [Fistulifera solaris]
MNGILREQRKHTVAVRNHTVQYIMYCIIMTYVVLGTLATSAYLSRTNLYRSKPYPHNFCFEPKNHTMVSSCSQNNVLSSDMHSHNHVSPPSRLGCRDLAQTVAPCTPQMIRTPVPRMRSTVRRLHLLTPQTAPRDDQDRFIPSRRRMNMDLCHRKLNSASKPCELLSSVACAGPLSAARSTKLVYEKQLLSTLCNVSTSDLDDELQLKSLLKYGSVSPSMTSNRRRIVAADPFAMDFSRALPTLTADKVNVTAARVIHSRPEVVLDAPDIVNDYYTHPLSWSKDNLLAVALGLSVYVMNESTRAVHEIAGVGITPLDENETSNYVRSVKWCTMDGLTHLLAVGTSAGVVRVYDTISNEEVVNPTLTSARSPIQCLSMHKGRILTLDMSPDGCKLASLGSDEMLCIWKLMRLQFDLATVAVVFAFLHHLDLVSSSVKCDFNLPRFVCPFVFAHKCLLPGVF